MEEPIKEQSATSVSGSAVKSKLRYPLRSATKKEEKPPVPELSKTSASKTVRTASIVSKSVGVLDLSAKDKTAKPPRRLSIPDKSTVTPSPKLVGNITPISEARARRSTNNGQAKSETPGSDITRPASQKKFNRLFSASYWLLQIKLSESAAKHSVSLGFFKLGFEAGCQPLQSMRDELKSYARRHNLSEHGDAVKELFELYNISENSEQLQVSEACSQVPEEGTRSSDDEVHSSSSIMGNRKLKPRSLNAEAAQVSSTKASAKKETSPKNNPPTRMKRSFNKNSANARSVSETGVQKLQKKTEKITKPKPNKEKDKTKKQEKKSTSTEGPVSPSLALDTVEQNKENMDAPAEEMGLTEA